jgi:hypothetical protein
MVPVFWPSPDTGPIIQPQATTFGLMLRYFEPFLTPDPFHPLVVDLPTFCLQQGGDPAVSIPSVLLGKINDPGSQLRLIVSDLWLISLC